MLVDNLKRTILKLPLDKTGKDELMGLLKLPEIETVLSNKETRSLEERTALIYELGEIPKKFLKPKAAAIKQAEAASKALDEAEAALRLAKDAHRDAQIAVYGLELQEQREIHKIEKELSSTSDKRLTDYYIHLSNLQGATNLKFEFWIDLKKNWLGNKSSVTHSNMDDINVTTQAPRFPLC